MAKQATAVALYRIKEGMQDSALLWQKRLDAEAKTHKGFVESRVTAAKNTENNWAAAVTFSSARNLNRWLRSAERHKLLEEGVASGMIPEDEIVFVEGSRPPEGVAVFFHKVATRDSVPFVQCELELQEKARSFPGFLGAVLLPTDKTDGVWISVMRFASDSELQAWLRSAERAEALVPLMKYLQKDFQVVTRQSTFGSIVAFDEGVAKATPLWKIAMIILMVLYPTVMLLTRFLSPVLEDYGLDPGEVIWVGNACSTVILTFLLTPLATRLFRHWLDPINGSDRRTSIKGAVTILFIYAVTLTLFLEVPYLQFWK